MKIVHSFSSFSVKDITAALDFYANKLGLKAKIDKDMGLVHIEPPHGAQAMLYPKGADHKPATYTVLNLIVPNISDAVDELTNKGITFKQYDNDYIKTDKKGISRSDDIAIAWFTDPDGNILAVIETAEK